MKLGQTERTSMDPSTAKGTAAKVPNAVESVDVKMPITPIEQPRTILTKAGIKYVGSSKPANFVTEAKSGHN